MQLLERTVPMPAIWLAVFSVLILAPRASAAEVCGAPPKQVASSLATANLFSNLFHRSSSIRAKGEEILQEAIAEAEELQIPEQCREQCDEVRRKVILESIPNRFVGDREQQQECVPAITRSQRRPFEVPYQHYASIDELYEWIMDFSQGKGEQGERLYDYCSRCSPQYTFFIVPTESEFSVRARVRCGYPRDRDDNQYRLTAAAELACVNR